ncbi:galactoside 2-alpha-L-fucosyltransferase 3-like [Pollicipes pollicipes]|uniref:galactoside 2-alpha-L-fucosyltransferase 3-like n=1 Tax=Pollicipes pollicipes TaxID=41117 RepID=UPI0018852AED|nr:galactoside 2-alpha-L-fucosyltransferase 3-like [Pollicipes pollicipes]
MSEYATLLAANGTLQRPAWLQPDMARTLRKYFVAPSLPVLHRRCKLRWTTTSLDELMADPGRDAAANHLITGFPHDVPGFHPLREQLLREFTFRPELRARAAARLAQVVRDANLTAPVFVGVHVRRTDYAAWMERSVRGHLVGFDYLYRAMALMRRRWPTAAFVVTSDDLGWCRRALRGRDVFLVGDRDVRRPGADLALLAACNHSILTHGTFGFWAGYLAGGQVVAPAGYGQRPTRLDEDVERAGLGWTRLKAFVYS